MPPKLNLQPQNPLLLRCHRLIEAFAKSDDEYDFYLDRAEGFIVYVDLEKPEQELQILEKEIKENSDRYCLIPKLTFYETKKVTEGFVNEKVYDIDTKEKLMEIIQSREAMANFLDFLNDHHGELEKWQQYYQERSRVRIIEWLRQNHFNFVFEEDLDFPRDLIEKLKRQLFETKVSKDILNARKELANKAKTYYSNEALNPRPKRGRPPKQTAKPEMEPQITSDLYSTVPLTIRPFLFSPSPSHHPANAFSARYENPDQAMHRRKQPLGFEFDLSAEGLKEKLNMLKKLSSKWVDPQTVPPANNLKLDEDEEDIDVDIEIDIDEESEIPVEKAPIHKAKVESKSTPKVKPTPKPKPRPMAKPTPKPQPVVSKSKPIPKPAPATKPKPRPMAKPTPKTKSMPKAKPLPKIKPAPKKKILPKKKK